MFLFISDSPESVTFDGMFDQIEASLAPMNYAECQATVLAVTNFVKYPKSMLDRVSKHGDGVFFLLQILLVVSMDNRINITGTEKNLDKSCKTHYLLYM